jgi:hypothetical protein
MPKGSSGKENKGNDDMKGDKPDNISIKNKKQARGRLVTVFTQLKIDAVKLFPEMQGQVYDNLVNLNTGSFNSSDVLGAYEPGARGITIANKVLKNRDQLKGWTQGNSLQHVLAHEMGHAFTKMPAKGHKGFMQAFDAAYAEHIKGIKKGKVPSSKEFARSISEYATTAKSEAFAEAFSDYLVNGKKAKPASRLIMKHWKA